MKDDFVDAKEEVVVGVACGVSVEAVDVDIIQRVVLCKSEGAVYHFVMCKRILENGIELVDVDVVLKKVAPQEVADRIDEGKWRRWDSLVWERR